MQEIPEAQIFVFEPGMIPGYGLGSNVDLHLQDRSDGDKGVFLEQTQAFLAALNERPEIQMAMTTYARNYPQYIKSRWMLRSASFLVSPPPPSSAP